MKKTNQIAWLLWLMTCAALSFYLSYGCCAQAQDQDSHVVPNVSCPSTALCVKDEKGIWIPYWYARDLLKIKAELGGAKADLDKALDEITALRIADAEHLEAEKDLERDVAFETKKADLFRLRTEKAEEAKNKKTRWLMGTSVVSIVVIGVLSAVVAAVY